MRLQKDELLLCDGIRAKFDKRAGVFACTVDWDDRSVLVVICCDPEDDEERDAVCDYFAEFWKERHLWKAEFENLIKAMLPKTRDCEFIEAEVSEKDFDEYYELEVISFTQTSEGCMINVEYAEQSYDETSADFLNLEGDDVNGFDRFFVNGMPVSDDTDEYTDEDEELEEDDHPRAKIMAIPMRLSTGDVIEYLEDEHIWFGQAILFNSLPFCVFECDEGASTAFGARELYERLLHDDVLFEAALVAIAEYSQENLDEPDLPCGDEAWVRRAEVRRDLVLEHAGLGNDGTLTLVFAPADANLKLFIVSGSAETGMKVVETGYLHMLDAYTLELLRDDMWDDELEDWSDDDWSED